MLQICSEHFLEGPRAAALARASGGSATILRCVTTKVIMRIRATRSLACKPHQIPHVQIIPSWCRGSRRHVSRRRAATTEQHSCLPAGRRGGSCTPVEGDRRRSGRSRGVEEARPHVRLRGGDLPSGSGPGGPPRPPADLTRPGPRAGHLAPGLRPRRRPTLHGGAMQCQAPAGRPATRRPRLSLSIPSRLHCIGMHANCTHPIPGPPAAPINTRRRARQAFTYRIDHRSPDRFASAGRLSSSRQFYITT